jgi:hypothetical protein
MQQPNPSEQVMPVPSEPIQPGCNPNSVFASSQCHDAWNQYQSAVQSRNDIIQHNSLVQARLAGEQTANQAANQVLQQHDAEIATLRTEISALTGSQSVFFAKGIATGAGSAFAIVLIVVFVRQFFQRKHGSSMAARAR